jgi:cob(I)alamin adenosyltransferase
MSIATRTGDLGTTALMYGRRVSKTDSRVETYGTVDELSSQLGIVRATTPSPWVNGQVLIIQKNLVNLMGELATGIEDLDRYRKDDRFPKLTPEALDHLDSLVKEIENQKITFDGWATPGDSLSSAALDVARSICRRAERRVVGLQEKSNVDHGLTIKFLNRLSDVLWLLARYTETKHPGGKE